MATAKFMCLLSQALFILHMSWKVLDLADYVSGGSCKYTTAISKAMCPPGHGVVGFIGIDKNL